MKAKILVLFGLLLLVPTAQADDAPDGYTVAYTPGGLGGGGTVYWYVGYPTVTHALGTYSISISASSTVAGAPVLAFAAGSGIASGCTIGTFVADPAVGSSMSGVVPITTTASSCTGNFRLTFTVAGAGAGEIRAGFSINLVCGISVGCLNTNANTDTISGNLNVHQDQACGASIPCLFSTTALTDIATILVPLLLILILVLWAEKTKNPILYLTAVLALAYTIVSLWTGLVGYRETLVLVLAFLAFRLYLTAKDVNQLEN
jgi:hypothetical protein